MTTTMKLDDYVAYRDKLAKCRAEKSTEVFFNDSAIHEEFVMKELLIYARESESGVNTMYIYCGSMSAFREDVRQIVERTKREMEPAEGSPDRTSWEDFDPYNKMVKELKRFFEEGGRMNVIVEDKDVMAIKNEAIWRDLLDHYYSDTRQLSIKRLPVKGGVNHFVVCGNAYRSELSHDDKTALCCFNNPEYANLLYANYSVLNKIAVPVTMA